MDIKKFIEEWIEIGNAFDTAQYLGKYKENAVLEDPSVGSTFKFHKGIREYFESYFIGYNTQTRLVRMEVKNENEAHVEVEFTGDFPGGVIGGTFDITFSDDKIARIKADLI